MQQNNKQATHEVLFTDILEIVALVGYTWLLESMYIYRRVVGYRLLVDISE